MSVSAVETPSYASTTTFTTSIISSLPSVTSSSITKLVAHGKTIAVPTSIRFSSSKNTQCLSTTSDEFLEVQSHWHHQDVP